MTIWAWVGLVTFALLAGIGAGVWRGLRRQRRARTRMEKRRRNIAYQKAWDWVKGRRALRLTDQRSVREDRVG